MKKKFYEITRNGKIFALKITLIYMIIGGLWILFSDKLLAALVHDKTTVIDLSLIKGWFFILITGLILFIMINRRLTTMAKSEAVVTEIAHGVSAETGQAFFASLVEHLAKALEVDFAFIGEVTGENKENITTVAMYEKGQLIDNLTTPLVGTPCSNVLSTGMRIYPSNVQTRFPDDALLSQKGAESYIGTPLIDSNGQLLGILAVLDTKPIEKISLAKSLLKIFAARAVAELERKQNEERINHLAFYDPLTNLPNRLMLNEQSKWLIDSADNQDNQAAVIYLDLDQFKLVNDVLGHVIGDEFLKKVAARLANCVSAEAMLARMGGDEFTIVLQNVNQVGEVLALAENILATLQQPFVMAEREFYITASMGITFCPNDGKNIGDLLLRADIAMFQAKARGGNRYQLFTPIMNNQIIERMETEQQLRQALKEEQFVVHYQPQVDIKTGKIIGTEALVRWQHPEKGLIPPNQFIPVAEATGLIVPIGEWVLRTACAQNKAWHEAGLPQIPVAVNLSARQFLQNDLIEKVATVIKETGLEGQWLELEITESLAMQNFEYSHMILAAFQELGIKISLDDFGTGYSSLYHLKKFPIQTLKIDYSFIKDLAIDESDAAIATAIIALAHSLNMKVIAEGVESKEQLLLLQEKECNAMQGYYFSKPIPAEEFASVLANN